ncbi:hypothetical protein ACOME3_001897 [Neoechinorhynchus agilis]
MEFYQLLPLLVSTCLSIGKSCSNNALSRHSRKCVNFLFNHIIYRYNGIDNCSRLIALVTESTVKAALMIVANQNRRSGTDSKELRSSQNILLCSIGQLARLVIEVDDNIAKVIDDTSIGFLHTIQTILQTRTRSIQLSAANLVWEITKVVPNAIKTLVMKQWLPRLDSSGEREGYSYCSAAAIYANKETRAFPQGAIEVAHSIAQDLIKAQRCLKPDQRKASSIHSGWVLISSTVDHLLLQNDENFTMNGNFLTSEQAISAVVDLIEQDFLFGMKNFDCMTLIGKLGALTCYKTIIEHNIFPKITSNRRVVVSKALSYLMAYNELSFLPQPAPIDDRTQYLRSLFELRLLQVLRLQMSFHKLSVTVKKWIQNRLLINVLLGPLTDEALILQSPEAQGDCALCIQTEIYANILPVNSRVLSSIDSSLISLEINESERDMYNFVDSGNHHSVLMDISFNSAQLLCQMANYKCDALNDIWIEVLKMQNLKSSISDSNEKYPVLWMACVIVERMRFDDSIDCRSLETALKDALFDRAMDNNEKLSVRMHSAKVLGILCRRAKRPTWLPTLCEILKHKIAAETDGPSRIVEIYSVAVLYRNCSGYQRTDWDSVVNLFINVVKVETNIYVQTWVLRSLGLIIDGCGLMYLPHINVTMMLLIGVLLNHSVDSTVDDENRIKQSIMRILASCITLIGPEIKDSTWSQFRHDTRFVCSMIMSSSTEMGLSDNISHSIYLYCLEQLHIFCPDEFNLQDILCQLWIGLQSDDFIIRCKSLQCLRQLCQREAYCVSDYISKLDNDRVAALEEYLFHMLDRERDEKFKEEVKDTLYLLLLSVSPLTMSMWISLLSRILISSGAILNTSQSIQSEKDNDHEDDDSVLKRDESSIHGRSREIGGFCGWRSRSFAAECVLELLGEGQMPKLKDPSHYMIDEAKSNRKANPDHSYLVLHISDLIRLAFMSTTSSSSTSAAHYGLRILMAIVDLFGNVKDEDEYILSQHDTQITTAIYRLLESLNEETLQTMIYDLCAKWLCSTAAISKSRLLKALSDRFSSKEIPGDSEDSTAINDSNRIKNYLAMVLFWAKMYLKNSNLVEDQSTWLLTKLGQLWVETIIAIYDNDCKLFATHQPIAILLCSSANLLKRGGYKSEFHVSTYTKKLLHKAVLVNHTKINSKDIFDIILGKTVQMLDDMNVNNIDTQYQLVETLIVLVNAPQSALIDYQSVLQLITLAHRLGKRFREVANELLNSILGSIVQNKTLISKEVESLGFIGLEPIGKNCSDCDIANEMKRVKICLEIRQNREWKHGDVFESKVLNQILSLIIDERTFSGSYDALGYLCLRSQQYLLIKVSNQLDKKPNLFTKVVMIIRYCSKVPSEVVESMRSCGERLLLSEDSKIQSQCLLSISTLFVHECQSMRRTVGAMFLRFIETLERGDKMQGIMQICALAYISSFSERNKRQILIQYIITKFTFLQIPTMEISIRYQAEYEHVLTNAELPIQGASIRTKRSVSPIDLNKFL